MTASIITTDHGSRLGSVEFIWARNSKEFLFANSIYVKGSPSLIIDPSAVFTYIESLALTQAVDIVVNSHYHADHRSLNGLFKKIIYAAHEADSACIRDYATYEEYADPDPNSFYSQWRRHVFEQYHIQDSPVSLMLKDGEIIDTGDTQIEVVHIPGHTPGHLAFHFKPINVLYLSDIDLTPYGPWYANIHSDIDAFKRSVKRISQIEADYYVTSHGERLYEPEKFQEKIARFAKHFDDRDQKIIDCLKDGPKELLHIASLGIVYRTAALKDPLKAYFQWQMVLKHLERLCNQGVVSLENNHYRLI